jgi:hypothetical protein
MRLFSKPAKMAVAFNAPGFGIAWDFAAIDRLAVTRATVA